MPCVSEKRRLIDWYLKFINAYTQQTKLVTLMKTEDMEDGFDTGSASSGSCGSLETVLSLEQSSSSRFSSSMPPSSSMSTGSCNSIKTTSSEMEDENLLQSIIVVNHLQSIRYLKPRTWGCCCSLHKTGYSSVNGYLERYNTLAYPRGKRRMKYRLNEDEYEHGWQLWQDCVGIVDRTFIPFARRPFPQDQAIYYWNYRKRRFLLNSVY